MTGLAATQEAYSKHITEIDDMRWICTGWIVAGAFTKVRCDKALRTFMDAGKLGQSVSIWVVLSKKNVGDSPMPIASGANKQTKNEC